MEITSNTVLVLGAGQIGTAICLDLLEKKPARLVVHSLTEAESYKAIAQLRQVADPGTEILAVWGNLFSPYEIRDCLYNPQSKSCCRLVYANGHEEQQTVDTDWYLHQDIRYNLDVLTHELLAGATLYRLVEEYRPALIVDAVNTATVAGYKAGEISCARQISHIWTRESSHSLEEKWDLMERKLVQERFLLGAVPRITRFVQVLYETLRAFQVKLYVKVSTTGLGGMGLAMQYTHGERGEVGFSSALLGKIAGAGILHQLLWTLAHTPGLAIRLVIPAALVGWGDEVGQEDVRLLDTAVVPLPLEEALLGSRYFAEGSDYFSVPYLNSGENQPYALGDMTAITALSQMGSITKEEVAQAVIETIGGEARYDVLAAMDNVMMGPTYTSAFHRRYVLEQLRQMDEEGLSLTLGNLGPQTGKMLLEAYLLQQVCTSIRRAADFDLDHLVKRAQEVVQDDPRFVSLVAWSGWAILHPNGRSLWRGAKLKVPSLTDIRDIREKGLTAATVNRWADEGWVDLRRENWARWQERLRKVIAEIEGRPRYGARPLDRNWQSLNLDAPLDVGELVGYIYSLRGGMRKLLL